MENILIIYKSKYGAAREYAQLLGKALDTAPVSVDQAKSQMVTSADTIILCGGIYASSIAGGVEEKAPFWGIGGNPSLLRPGCMERRDHDRKR